MKERKPEEMLSEARDRLTKCRKLFILSTLMLMSKPTAKEELVFWGNIWFNASLEEEKITRDLVVPAKLNTGAFRTVPRVERKVRKEASDFIKKFLSEPKDAFGLARAIVDPHIIFTKEIQKKMGVPDYIVYLEKTRPGRENIPFFAPGASGPTPEKVAC